MTKGIRSYFSSFSIHFRAMLLSDQEIILDIGANRGLVTKSLAKISKARIYAYEPDPVPYQKLLDTSKSFVNVSTVNEGVSVTNGTANLYLHQDSSRDRLSYSTGSSLCLEKNNVSEEKNIPIYCRDIDEIVNKFRRVALLKLDVEGAEIDILNRLIDTGSWKLVKRVYVETHEKKMGELYNTQLTKLRQKTRKLKWKINYDWK